MLLEDIKWEGPSTVEEIHAWGIEPLLDQLEVFDYYCERHFESSALGFFYYDFRDRVERLNRALYRFADEMEAEAREKGDGKTDLRKAERKARVQGRDQETSNARDAKALGLALKAFEAATEDQKEEIETFLRGLIQRQNEKAPVTEAG